MLVLSADGAKYFIRKEVDMKNTNLNDDDLEILKLLFDQWKFRLAQYWSLMLKFYFATSILMLLPLMHGTWGVQLDALGIPMWILPVFGLATSIAIYFLARVEINRINEIKSCINNTIKEASLRFNEALPSENKLRGAHQNFPFVFLCFQSVLAIIMIIFILRS